MCDFKPLLRWFAFILGKSFDWDPTFYLNQNAVSDYKPLLNTRVNGNRTFMDYFLFFKKMDWRIPIWLHKDFSPIVIEYGPVPSQVL